MSHTTVQRIWHAHEFKPHLVHTFKLSNDKYFVEKLRDVIGLYLNPPEHALVFCVDEKSQIQALDRSQPGLPMKKGRAGTMTHDYKRHATTTLFAALNVFEGTVIGKCYQRHRHTEYLRFLREIDRMTPQGLDVHLIVDNYSAHKHERVKKWLARHPHFNVHFIPTCVFHAMPVSDSTGSRSSIPWHPGHSFHAMPVSDSTPSRSLLTGS